MNKVLAAFKANLKQYSMMLALVVIGLIFQVLTGGKLLLPMNVFNIINQNAYIVILAIGMLLCIVGSGSIDLSVGSVVGLVGACAGTFIMKWKWDPYLSIVLCMLVGVLVGAWQGFWIAYVKIPAFIVTLSGMLVFRGATLIILQGGRAIPVFPDAYKQFFVGTMPEFIGVWEVAGMKIYLTCLLLGILIAAVYCITQVLSNQSKKRKGYEYATPGALITRMVIISAIVIWFFTLLARYRGIPSVLIVMGVIAAIYTFITNKTVIGRHIYAMGGNAKAARLSGVKTERLMFLSYINMGLLAGIAGMVFAARLDSATPMAGDGFELDAIGACYIGGASAYGGVGTVSGTVIGALIMGILNNGMNIIGMDSNVQKLVKGLVLLAAVAFDVLSQGHVALPSFLRLGKSKPEKVTLR
ncbi:MAG: sugar ABC transporter permease [Eubacteriales bacterium]|jgi:putative multiple sugar transport system permease protein|nr:sugar ABC transporter permease [Eubacteriales bacterium]MDD4105773.1 sugar ABC transporter permease [Eubacteriales bacterium]MDD4710757.1 sugar ABC transporter permease [Eubacteriales bacterium]NLO14576.1 sugar ABC transporter permease [Clostridiales bacterium]